MSGAGGQGKDHFTELGPWPATPIHNGMALELATFQVDDVVIGSETRFVDGVLSINPEELRTLLLRDGYFADIDIEIVRPGEDSRIIHIVDVVEPRVRVSAPGSDFPGLLGPPQTMGSGRTHRLNGVGVVEVSEPVPGEATHWSEAIIDMTGEGIRYSPFSILTNIVLTFRPRPELFSTSETYATAKNVFAGTPQAIEYNLAVRRAGLKAAVYLAETTKNLDPDRVDVYDLKPCLESKLPKVVYLFQVLPYVYGEMAPGALGSVGPGHLPTIIHPNEIFDGALVNSFSSPACMRDATYLLQNHAVIQDLYERHGRDLDFRGVIIYMYGDSVKAKERTVSYAARLASILEADGAILTHLGGGHPSVDVMLLCQKLEQQGVKTVMLLVEMAANPTDSGFVHYVNEADAIISTGNYEQRITVPSCHKVLGGTHILESGEDATGPLTLTVCHFLASTNQFGYSHLRGRQY